MRLVGFKLKKDIALESNWYPQSSSDHIILLVLIILMCDNEDDDEDDAVADENAANV